MEAFSLFRQLFNKTEEEPDAADNDRNIMKKQEGSEQKGAGEGNGTSDRMLFETLMDNLDDYVYFKDLNSRFILVNKAYAQKVFSLSDGQKAVGRTDFDFFPREHAAFFYENDQEIIRTGEPLLEKEVKQTWPDGHVTWLMINMYPLRDKRGNARGTWGIWRDITAQKQAEEELQSSEEMLGQAQKMEAFGQLAGGIAHDFNNLLSVILGSAQLVEMEISGDQPDLKHNIAMVIDTARKATDLTRQLLSFARKGKCNIVELDVHEVVRSVVSLLANTFDKRIRIVDRLNAPQSFIKGDYLLLQNALLNLSFNARDAMPEGGTLTFSTDIVGPCGVDCDARMLGKSPGRQESFLRIKVADTGIGMEEKVKRRAFEPFFTTKTPGKGTGLGLVNVYGTVKNLSGLIELETEVNKGTTFSLYFPLIGQRLEKPAEEPTGGNKGGRTVLVVDDEDRITHALVEMLASLGYASVVQTSGGEAVDFYRDHHGDIDAIIVDLIMPGMNSVECIKMLRQINSNAVVLISSGFNLVSDTQQIISKGIAGFLQKPFEISELAKTMSEALAGR